MRNLRSDRKWRWLAALLWVFPPAAAGAGEITPEEIKASYILKMLPFITVGEPAHAVRSICYYEKSGVPLSESAGQVLAKYLRDNPPAAGAISVKHFQAIRDLSGCDIFYIPAEEEGNISNILSGLDSSPTLTISGAKHFILRGGMIGFVLDDANRVKMEANLKNIRAQHVRVDPQILEIMQQVVGQ